MKLYFLRHADAEPAGPDGDAARRLTKAGKKDSARAAKALKKWGVKADLLLSSPLKRAKQTAKFVAKKLNVGITVDDRLGGGCDVAALREAVAAHGGPEAVILVGHEPDFSSMVEELTGGRVDVKKCGLALVECEAIEPGLGTLLWLLTPTQY